MVNDMCQRRVHGRREYIVFSENERECIKNLLLIGMVVVLQIIKKSVIFREHQKCLKEKLGQKAFRLV